MARPWAASSAAMELSGSGSSSTMAWRSPRNTSSVLGRAPSLFFSMEKIRLEPLSFAIFGQIRNAASASYSNWPDSRKECIVGGTNSFSAVSPFFRVTVSGRESWASATTAVPVLWAKILSPWLTAVTTA